MVYSEARDPNKQIKMLSDLITLDPTTGTHYIDVIMTTMASQITSLPVVDSTVYSDADQIKHQSSASLVFVWGIHRDRWIPRTKGQLRGKCFHLMTSMTSSWMLNIEADRKCLGLNVRTIAQLNHLTFTSLCKNTHDKKTTKIILGNDILPSWFQMLFVVRIYECVNNCQRMIFDILYRIWFRITTAIFNRTFAVCNMC